MKTLKRHQLGSVLVSFVLLLAAAQGCNDSSDNAEPPDVNGGGSNSAAGEDNTAGSSGKTASHGGSSGKAGSSGTGTGTEGGSGSSDGGTPPIAGSDDGGAGAGGAPATPTCTLPELGADACFNCPKNGQVAQWLNRCSDSDCEPFPNKARLALLKADGSVPALPN